MTDEIMLKGLVEEITQGFLEYIDSNSVKETLYKMVQKSYMDGLEEAEIQFDMNFTPDTKSLNFIQEFSFDNVTKLTNDLKDNLKREVNLGIMNRESTSAIRSRIRDVLDTTIERAEMIQRTELNRANNMGFFEGARDSGLSVKKKWDAQPERTSRKGNRVPCVHCEYLDGQVVDMNAQFVDDKGKNFFLPPHHPNCACRVIYIQEDN